MTKAHTRDHHSPANMDPATYNWVGTIYQGPTSEWIMGMVLVGMEPEMIRAEIDRLCNKELKDRVRQEGKYFGNWRGKQSCDHCGVHFHYGDVYEHAPSGELIVVGWMCSEDAFSYENRQTLDHARRKREIANRRARGKKAAEVKAFLDDNPGLEEILTLGNPEGGREEYILDSMRCKLLHYGPTMTEKQIEYAKTLAEQIRSGDTAEARKQKREEERAAKLATAEPWTEGRQSITGTVLSIREPDEYDTYQSYKMLVELESGIRCWGTIPSALTKTKDGWRTYQSLRGCRVSFRAKIQPKKGDSHFAFFSRPSKGAVVKEVDS